MGKITKLIREAIKANAKHWREMGMDAKAELDVIKKQRNKKDDALRCAVNRMESIRETNPEIHLDADIALYKSALSTPTGKEAR